jgi:hypothetical protein
LGGFLSFGHCTKKGTGSEQDLSGVNGRNEFYGKEQQRKSSIKYEKEEDPWKREG